MPARKTAAKAKPVAASYSYTGCWSCRRRHVKCDETKPACNRCIKAGYECEGYEFRFAGSGSSRTYRRPIASANTGHSEPPLTGAQVSGILDELEYATESSIKGPFSVLCFSDADCRGNAVVQTSQSLPLRPASLTPSQELEAREDALYDSGYGSPQRMSEKSAEDEVVRDLSNAQATPLLLHEPSLLMLNARQAELFEHWTTYLCENLSPCSQSVANPFRHVYPSLALEGLMASPDISSARLAVFHGMCGTAAHSLWSMRPDDSTYHALSVNHDQMALRCIQQTVERAQGLQDAAISAAIMACLTGDILSSRLALWGKHLQGGFRSLLGVISRQKFKNNTLSSVCQQYLLAATFANFGTPSQIRLIQSGINDNYNYLRECHCITPEMINCVIAINFLAASDMRHDASKVENVRIQLLHSVPKFEDPLQHHLSYAYYYAILIYFIRALLRSDNTHHAASQAMENLECAGQTGRGNCGRILQWVLITIGRECRTLDLQRRLLAWCNSQLKVRQNNFNPFLEVLQKTWRYHDLNIAGNDDQSTIAHS